MRKIRLCLVSLLCALMVQTQARAGWIKNGVELGVVVDVVTLSALAIATKKAVDLVNNPAYRQQIDAIARGMSHHLVLGRVTVLAALNEVAKLNPGKQGAVNQVAADLGLINRPPGDCDPGRHKYLQDNVDAACKPFPGRCSPADMCTVVSEKLSRFTGCAEARQLINTECFRGGDRGHQIAYTAARQEAAICGGMTMSCRN
jgi:hypothetical protein